MDISDGFKGMFADMGIDIDVFPFFIRPADGMMPLKVGDELYIERLI
jgi:hypothetical protein